MTDLADAIRRLAANANEADSPDKIIFGKVTNCSYYIDGGEEPQYVKRILTIQVSDKFILTEEDPFLMLPKNMRDKVESTAQPLYFNAGDTAILMRIEKGSKYLLLDVI